MVSVIIKVLDITIVLITMKVLDTVMMLVTIKVLVTMDRYNNVRITMFIHDSSTHIYKTNKKCTTTSLSDQQQQQKTCRELSPNLLNWTLKENEKKEKFSNLLSAHKTSLPVLLQLQPLCL